MCVVSNTGDMWNRRLIPWQPYISPYRQEPYVFPQAEPSTTTKFDFKFGPQGPTQEDFDALKREVEIMKEALKCAKEYDERNGEPDCEIEEKMKFLRQVAKAVGVDLDEVLKKKQDIPAVNRHKTVLAAYGL